MRESVHALSKHEKSGTPAGFALAFSTKYRKKNSAATRAAKRTVVGAARAAYVMDGICR